MHRLQAGLPSAEELHEHLLELVAEDAVDEEVHRGVDGHQQVGDLDELEEEEAEKGDQVIKLMKMQ